MIGHLGTHFREQRLKHALSLGQLARWVGYRNVSKGANKVCRLEREGITKDELLVRLADALGIDLPTVEQLIEQDRQERLREWEAWANEPVPMVLIAHLMPAVYRRVPLPDEVRTPEEAERYACVYAKEHERHVCLAVSRRLSIWINKDGMVYGRTEATPNSSNLPGMTLRGNNRRFLFGFGDQELRKAPLAKGENP